MRHRLLIGACLACLLFTTSLFGQSRSLRAERIVLDDANGNTIIVQTPVGPITGGTLTIPDPAGNTTGSFLISTPSGGTQDVAGDLLPGTDATFDLGSPSSQWQDIFASGRVNAGSLAVAEPGGADRTMLVAQTQAGDITYTLPASVGTAGTVLSIAAAPAPTAIAATLEWATPSEGSGVGDVLFARKTVLESVTSVDTLQPDNQLFVALDTGRTYEIEGLLYVSTTNAAHDIKLAFTVPSGATMKVSYHGEQSLGSTSRETDVLTVSGTAGTSVSLVNGASILIYIRGLVRTAGTVGNLSLLWSDTNNGGSESVTVAVDSYLKITHVQ